MTPGELKFALHVENILSTVSQPEYRQLLLESLMILTMVIEYEPRCRFDRPVNIRAFVIKAYALYLEDQVNRKFLCVIPENSPESCPCALAVKGYFLRALLPPCVSASGCWSCLRCKNL